MEHKIVESTLEGVEFFSTGACPGCDDCGLSDVDSMDDKRYELAGEPNFSWSRCKTCHSTLGGDRHPAHGFINNELCHFSICTDCLSYFND